MDPKHLIIRNLINKKSLSIYLEEPNMYKINPFISNKMTNYDNFCQILKSFLSICGSKVGSGSGSVFGRFPGSVSEILDFSFEDPSPKLII